MADLEHAALIWAGVAESPALGTCAHCRNPLGGFCIAAAPAVLEVGVRAGSPCLLCFSCAGAIGRQHEPVARALRRAKLRNREELKSRLLKGV